jgi:hypothetical protein
MMLAAGRQPLGVKMVKTAFENEASRGGEK